MPRQRLRDLGIALSLANLCFLRTWPEVLLRRPKGFGFLKSLRWLSPLASVTLNVLLLAGLFWVAVTLARRSKHAYPRHVAGAAFLLVLILPLNIVRAEFPSVSVASLRALFGGTGLVALGVVLAIPAVIVLLRWYGPVIHMAATFILVLFPFCVMTLSEAAWIMAYNTLFIGEEAARPRRVGETPGTPVLWLLFDEMDQRVTFLERPPSVQLRELDNFRSQAVYASNAYPPATSTDLSMSALITGKLVGEAKPVFRDGDVTMTFADAMEAVTWSTQRTVFSEAREMGFQTAVVGWYLPYCEALSSSLTACSWRSLFGAEGGRAVSDEMRGQIRTALRFFPFLMRLGLLPSGTPSARFTQYLGVLGDAKKAATNPGGGLVLVHWPVPHFPGIYNRFKSDFTLDGHSYYLDNLVLVDRTLGELRRAMESVGRWEDSAILITSDHAWGDRSWFNGRKDGPFWKEDHRVPFLLKLPGQKGPLAYEPAFNTVLTHDLILALLRGELSSSDGVISWLDRHRSIDGGSLEQ